MLRHVLVGDAAQEVATLVANGRGFHTTLVWLVINAVTEAARSFPGVTRSRCAANPLSIRCTRSTRTLANP